MLRARIVEQAVDQREIEPPLVGLDQFPAYRYEYRIEVEPGQPFPARRHIGAARRARIGQLAAEQQPRRALDAELATLDARNRPTGRRIGSGERQARRGPYG